MYVYISNVLLEKNRIKWQHCSLYNRPAKNFMYLLFHPHSSSFHSSFHHPPLLAFLLFMFQLVFIVVVVVFCVLFCFAYLCSSSFVNL